MLKASNIIRENSKTFYNFRTGQSLSIVPRYTVILIASGLLALFFNQPFSDLYAGFISAQAILIGFSFNVLVYLASSDLLIARDPSVLEDEAKVAKLNTLSGEIVYNLSYFNLVALLSIVLSLTLIGGNSFDRTSIISSAIHYYGPASYPEWVMLLRDAIRVILVWLAYATVFDSFLTFIRVSRRVTYFFVEKRKLSSGPLV